MGEDAECEEARSLSVRGVRAGSSVLTLHFPEGADTQRVPQNVVADLHPPVVLLLLGRRHLSPGTESAHGAAGGGGGGG